MKKLHKTMIYSVKDTMQIYCGCHRPPNCGCGMNDPNSYMDSYRDSEAIRNQNSAGK